MTGRERIWRALRGEACPRPARGEILFTGEFIKKSPVGDLYSAALFFGSDLVTLPIPATPSPLWETWRKKKLFLMGSLSGPLSTLIETKGWKGAATLIVKKREEAVEIMRGYLERGVSRIKEAESAGCEGVLLADDIAGGRGLLFSPSFLAECYFPLLAEYINGEALRTIPLLFHSDGNILEMIPHIKAAGFKGIQGLQPSVGIGPEHFDPEEFQDFVFWGNFEFEGDGRLKTIPEVEGEVDSLLKRWEKFPGYIFGSSGGIYGGLKPRTVKAACERARQGFGNNRLMDFLP